MLSEALTSDPIHAELLEKVSTSSALKTKVLQRSTSLQVLLLSWVRTRCCVLTHRGSAAGELP